MTRFLAAAALCCTAAVAQDWPFYGGDQGGSKYSPLD
jgi:glucose dehydrogenase